MGESLLSIGRELRSSLSNLWHGHGQSFIVWKSEDLGNYVAEEGLLHTKFKDQKRGRMVKSYD